MKELLKEPKKEERQIYSVVHTAVDNERGYYPDPEIKGSFWSLEAAREEMEKLIVLEEDELDSRYDTRERKTDVWEAYQNGCAVVCFSRIEIISSVLKDQSGCAQANLERVRALRILDELDAFRRSHQDDRQHPSDYCMRAMEAVVAKEYGFQNRMDWTEALSEDTESRYHQDLLHSSGKGF